MITEEQRLRRKQGLFSSDVARIMLGQEVQVALEKMGQLEETDLSEVMEINIGSKAEALILDAYERQTGFTLQRNLDTLLHPSYPWLGCHRDAIHEGVNVEAKTVGYYNRDNWGDGGDEVPDYVLWQVQQQMACSGHTVTKIPVCFISNLSLKYLFLEQAPPITIFEVKKDYELEAYLIQKAGDVWGCVQSGITPIPRTLDDVKLLYPKAIEPAVEADDDIELAWKRLLEIRQYLKQAEQTEEELKVLLQSYMSTASVLQKGGVTLATWKNARDSERFDEKRFADEHPDLYKQYMVSRMGARRFLVKAPKERT